MRIQTLSILAGSEACNARCPFCISKMTPPLGVHLQEPEIHWRNFQVACKLARQCGVTTVMLTGKGEPTLFPDQITKFLHAMREFAFPMIELQTNGLALVEQPEKYARHLDDWFGLGLTLVAVSIVHFRPEFNQRVYSPHKQDYIDLPDLIRKIHSRGLSVRLAAVMAEGFIDNPANLRELIDFARENKVEQLTVRPVNRPANSRNPEVSDWANRHYLKPAKLLAINRCVQKSGVLLMTLPHGAQVFDVDGQNICLTDSLTIKSKSDDLRQLIFFPDGHLRYDWQYPGAILL